MKTSLKQFFQPFLDFVYVLERQEHLKILLKQAMSQLISSITVSCPGLDVLYRNCPHA